MNWAWPPSCAIPASNEARVRVLEKKNSIASTLSSQQGVGLTQGAAPLEVEGHLQHRVDLVAGSTPGA